MSSSWASLSSVDKQAFYSILDEYFDSRPHLFQQQQQQTSSKNGESFSALSSLAGSNPKMTAAALKSAGVPPSLAKPSNVSAASSASKHLNGVGNKVGQLSGKFGNHFANSDQNQQQPPPANPSSKPNGFPNMNKFAATPPISHQNSFAPPPTRRVAPVSTTPAYSQPPPAPPARSKSHHDEELVEALYDYDGTSSEDLSFKEHQIIKVTEHISDDWWNGQIDNGPIGMFPSSYVKSI
ncbi:hypothetical protein MJO28_014845 [Puccinia striiformis f. sp. tritici]|uniref:SH3 domain-containing protein n=4 Tax=Puccinia striiformis TaxID=27350 RepID=A0A0L0UVE7_9BASI|nr:hypothetical protein Pst134EA_027725 [Puccinia striiformis f. sp. tritici]KAI9625215.1 hypothetical protein H4Q26_016406 [Puccinia striiformis f. sp. tritici PST-130]KNE90921.1 hypothetical protein PSTG_15667 [Puccinia striiformis f. sp. tritici PST-78]POW03078.1 hypothetical protein PSTT_11349 [Puccinia striiformis]KAH9442017.1 hypothetical protein Pst134EB_028291 [Puccinia striiformis f. sp. tritici]KAH9448414.1 hypothetical protein Pst134EA_027725 [Puccinia striiformis f. sp. tritici]